eukprot:TRINITY_DN49403_c0_g1_i1.p1 TRINITY_DN49403_c0_g1~~TRINITY_DN49403_c0_g1_i1.p1  ORF type:complete len:362 (-),score=79.01 TRINITY_DN49403_c0_g1_i1:24-1019(-)
MELVLPALPKKDGLVFRLDCTLPNFAYSVALSLRLGAGTEKLDDSVALRSVVVADCLPGATVDGDDDPERLAARPHAALMRAMLLFPQVLRPLLAALSVNFDASAPADSAYKTTWSQLLEKAPLSQHRESRHNRHALTHAVMSDAYAKLVAPLWRDPGTLAWLHSCAGRLVQMFESSLFAGELAEARQSWCAAPLGLQDALELDYKDFSSLELGPERRTPPCIERALGSLLAAAPALPQAAQPLDEEEELQRALRLSAAAEESRERRRLVEEQDRELQESLAVDQAAGQSSEETSSNLALLLEMGFETDAARKALAQTNGDAAAAIAILTS